MPRVPDSGSRVTALGVAGAPAPQRLTTSFRLGKRTVLDTGAAAHGLTVPERAQLDTILLSHAHLDHTLGIPFLLAEAEFTIYGAAEALDAVRENLLDGRTWPNLEARAVWNVVAPGDSFAVHEFDIEVGPADHTVPCLSYAIGHGDHKLVVIGDTRYSDKVVAWAAAQKPDACVVEVSYPDAMRDISQLYGHQSPSHLRGWREALGAECHLYVTHIKPKHEVAVRAECVAQGDPHLVLLQDGDELTY